MFPVVSEADKMNQGISSHGIGLIPQEYSGLRERGYVFTMIVVLLTNIMLLNTSEHDSNVGWRIYFTNAYSFRVLIVVFYFIP